MRYDSQPATHGGTDWLSRAMAVVMLLAGMLLLIEGSGAAERLIAAWDRMPMPWIRPHEGPWPALRIVTRTSLALGVIALGVSLLGRPDAQGRRRSRIAAAFAVVAASIALLSAVVLTASLTQQLTDVQPHLEPHTGVMQTSAWGRGACQIALALAVAASGTVMWSRHGVRGRAPTGATIAAIAAWCGVVATQAWSQLADASARAELWGQAWTGGARELLRVLDLGVLGVAALTMSVGLGVLSARERRAAS